MDGSGKLYLGEAGHEQRKYSAPINPAMLTWARLRASYSIERLAKELEVNQATIRDWETGTPPPFTKARRIAKILSIPFGSSIPV